MQWLRPHEYARVREEGRRQKGLPMDVSPLPPIQVRAEPRAVGRQDPRNVVIGPTCASDGEHVADAYIDLSHPALFDHPGDHLPGMLEVEVFRQATISAAEQEYGIEPKRAVMVACDASYSTYGELDEPTSCVIRLQGALAQRGGATVRVPAEAVLLQSGRQIAAGSVTLLYQSDLSSQTPPSPSATRRVSQTHWSTAAARSIVDAPAQADGGPLRGD
jgi:hypothetical protein